MRIGSLFPFLVPSLVPSLAVGLCLVFPHLAQGQLSEDQYKNAFLSSSGCLNAVSMDEENIYIGFGNYLRTPGSGARQPIPSRFEVTLASDPTQHISAATLDGVVAFQRVGPSLFVLTYSALEEWDAKTMSRVGIYPTYAIERDMQYKEHATGMIHYGGKLFISHGRLGISVFDIASKRLIKQERLAPGQWPLESQAVDITLAGSKAIIAMDNFSLVQGPPPLRGFVVYDLASMSVEREVTGLDPGATSIVSDGHSVVVGYDGPLWKFDLNTVLAAKQPAPNRLVWKYPLPGHPIGKPFMTANYIYTCFLQVPVQPGDKYKMIPQVLSRKDLKLD